MYCTCMYSTEYRVDMIQNGRYTAVDPTSPRLSTPYWSVSRRDAYMYMYLELYSCAGRPVGLPESAITLGKVQNGVYKGSGRCFTGFLRCVEVSHDLDCLDVLYRVVRIYCSLWLHRNHVISRCSAISSNLSLYFLHLLNFVPFKFFLKKNYYGS